MFLEMLLAKCQPLYLGLKVLIYPFIFQDIAVDYWPSQADPGLKKTPHLCLPPTPQHWWLTSQPSWTNPMNFSPVASVKSPMMMTNIKPSSCHAFTPSAQIASPNFPTRTKSIKLLFNAPTAGPSHTSQKIEWMDYKLTSILLVYKSSQKISR